MLLLESAIDATPKRREVEESRAVLIVNTASRSGREAFAQAQECLEAHGITLADAFAVRRPGLLSSVIEGALRDGAQRLLVGGGDGTLGGAARALVDREVTLGVIPLGTGNDFARSLGIEPTIPRACEVIATGFSARVDVGLANGRPFLNAASLGLASAIARRLTKKLKQRMGKLAYPVAAAAEAWDHKPFRVQLTTEDGVTTLDALQVVVGNGRFHGAGNIIDLAATLDDRIFHIYAIAAPSVENGREGTGLGQLQDLATLGKLSLAIRSGEHVDHPAVVTLRASRLLLEAEPPQEVNADGELMGETPVRFEVKPGALRVFVPPPEPRVTA